MTEATALPPAAERYLEQLRLEAAVLPAPDRQQLLGQIREHLIEAVDDGSDADHVLERLGSPRELVAAAGAETAAPSSAPWRPGALLWLAVAAVAVGALMLLWGGSLMLVTGRGRSLLVAVPGLLLAAAGAMTLVRQLRASHDDPAAADTKRRIGRSLAITGVAAGAALLLWGGLLFAMTGRWRSMLFAAPGMVLAIVGIIGLVLAATRPKRERS